MATKFNPKIHTKDYLLKNPIILVELASNSSEFAVSDLASDVEILFSKYRGDFIVKLLAKDNSQWSSTEIAQNENVLRFKVDDENWTVAHALATYQSHWAESKAAKNFEILKLADLGGYTVAHQLASNQPEWAKSEEAQNIEILKLANNNRESVAHYLANFRQAWIKTPACRNIEVLTEIKDTKNQTVAHYLAACHPDWGLSEESQNKAILALTDGEGNTVAHYLSSMNSKWLNTPAASDSSIMQLTNKVGLPVSLKIGSLNKTWLTKPPAYDKHVLSKLYQGKSVAEHLVDLYIKRGDFDWLEAAYRLVIRGAAFKVSSVVDPLVGEALLNKTIILVHDSLEPVIAVRHSCALHSTILHFKEAAKNNEAYFASWSKLADEAERFLRNMALVHHDAIDDHIFCDLNCEISDAIVNQITTQINLERSMNSAHKQDSVMSDNQSEMNKTIY